jgi:hypothetical protein
VWLCRRGTKICKIFLLKEQERQQIPPQELHSSTKLHGVKSNKTLSLLSVLSCWRSHSGRQRVHRWDKLIGAWRKVYNGELYALYCSPDVICVVKSRRMGLAGHVVHMGDRGGPIRVLVGKPEGKRPLGRPRRVW